MDVEDLEDRCGVRVEVSFGVEVPFRDHVEPYCLEQNEEV